MDEAQRKSSCVIKSHPNGITLLLDAQTEFEQLIRDICVRFAEARDFFGKADLILALEGRNMSDEEAKVVIEAIELNSDVHILYLADGQRMVDLRETTPSPARETADGAKAAAEELPADIQKTARIIRGSVTEKRQVKNEAGLVILGDLKKYASASAGGNVIVLGTLAGKVCAGEPNGTDCYIIAGRLEADTVTIGGVTGEVTVRQRGVRFGKGTAEPLVIRLWEGKMLAEPLSSGLIKKR